MLNIQTNKGEVMNNLITSNLNATTQILNEQGIKLYTFNHGISFDCFLSQIYFDGFKSEIENQSLWFGSNQTDYLVIFENEALKDAPYYKKSHLAKMKKLDLYELCEQYEILDYYHSDSFFEDNTKQNLIDELMKYCTNELYYKWHYNEASWHNLEYSFDVSGYCQGDKVKVLLVGNVESWINEKSLTNIFFDAPLQGTITIELNHDEHETIDLNECDSFDMYKYYDKSDIIELISKETSNKEYHNLLIEYLESNLKDNFDYSH